MKIIVTGGIYPRNWEAIQKERNENFIRFSEGIILIIDWNEGRVTHEISYVSPQDIRNPSMMFKCGEVYNNNLNVVTNSEIVTYDIATWEIRHRITHPSFNDLHAVMEESGTYWVVNTGLEMVQRVTPSGEIVQEYNLVPQQNTWERFDRSVDYRKIGSTKPHYIHANHIFRNNNDYFVTRMLQKDAVSIYNSSTKFNIIVGNPHDGIKYKGKIFFTTTNGHAVIFDDKYADPPSVFNLRQLLSKSNMKLDGWCRGIFPFGKHSILVGFTQLRKTKFNEFASWVRHLGNTPAPSRIVEFDLENGRAIKEFILPNKKEMAIFSILAHPCFATTT